MKIFVIHTKIFRDRFLHISNLLLDCKFTTCIEYIMAEDSTLNFANAEEKVTVLPDYYPIKETTDNEKSLAHKFITALDKIRQTPGYSIILEDDAIFHPDDLDSFVSICDGLPADCDWCFFGTGCDLKLPGNGFIHNTNDLKTRCTDSMIVSHLAAGKVFDDICSSKWYGTGPDWELNYRFNKLNLNVYWYEPGIVKQGSETGLFKSGIR